MHCRPGGLLPTRVRCALPTRFCVLGFCKKPSTVHDTRCTRAGAFTCDESDVQLQAWTPQPQAQGSESGESEHALLRREVSRLVSKMHRDFRPQHELDASSRRRPAESLDATTAIDTWRCREPNTSLSGEPLHVQARRLGMLAVMRARLRIIGAILCAHDTAIVPSSLPVSVSLSNSRFARFSC